MPPLEELLSKWEYDPVLGGLFKIGDDHTEANCLGYFSRAGYKVVSTHGCLWQLHRIVYYMFYRKDPGALMVDHKNGDRADNRIQNLRRVRPRKNSQNLKSKGKYVVDADGVGKWVTGVP